MNMEQKIVEKVQKNEWLNGTVDIREGDPSTGWERQEIFSKVTRINDINELATCILNYDGVFWYKNLVFANDHAYGCFVYAILRNGKIKEFEHLNINNKKELIRLIRRFERIRTENDIKEYFGF